MGVLHVTKGKEQHAGEHDQHQLPFNRRHQQQDGQADRHPHQRADDPQRQSVAGGVIVRLTDKQAGQQDPVAMLEPSKLDKGIAGAEHQRHTYRVAKESGLR